MNVGEAEPSLQPSTLIIYVKLNRTTWCEIYFQVHCKASLWNLMSSHWNSPCNQKNPQATQQGTEVSSPDFSLLGTISHMSLCGRQSPLWSTWFHFLVFMPLCHSLQVGSDFITCFEQKEHDRSGGMIPPRLSYKGLWFCLVSLYLLLSLGSLSLGKVSFCVGHCPLERPMC